MSEKKHERPIPPFSDLHNEDGKVRVTLLYDPKVDGLDTALYLDSSGSMDASYSYTKQAAPELQKALAGGSKAAVTSPPPIPKKGLLARIFGWDNPVYTGSSNQDLADDRSRARAQALGLTNPSSHITNEVEPHARELLKYLAGKDRNGRLRTCYWSEGVQPLGELTAADIDNGYRFGGANYRGGTRLAPAVEDFLRYINEQAKSGAKRGFMVIMTDGKIEDIAKIKKISAEVAEAIAVGNMIPINFLIMGVGSGVDEEQLEDLAHEEYEGIGHLWCHRVAEELNEITEVAASLVNESMIIAPSGILRDENGKVLQEWKNGLPAVFEFQAPKGQKSFSLEFNNKKHDQRIPDEEDDHETADDDHD